MPYDLKDKLVIGISSRALFELEEENKIFETQGVDAYAHYQYEHENDILKPGAGFPLAKALLRINEKLGEELVEVIIMSRNSADTSLRIFNSIEHYKLNISRAALAGGDSLSPYLDAFSTDLFLSANRADVSAAIRSGTAAGLIYTSPQFVIDPDREIDPIKIAFDGDAVIFSDEAERIYKSGGLEAFEEHERAFAKKPLPEGPFAKLLKTISFIQSRFSGSAPIRTALVTARNAPCHERAIRTLRSWNVRIDEAFFLGGVEKSAVLEAFGADIFFDDQSVHASPASRVVPSALVAYDETE